MNRDRSPSALVSAAPCEYLAGKRTSPGGPERRKLEHVAGRRLETTRRRESRQRAHRVDRDETSHRTAAVSHFDDLAAFDNSKVAARLLSELPDADRPHVLLIAHSQGVRSGYARTRPAARRTARASTVTHSFMRLRLFPPQSSKFPFAFSPPPLTYLIRSSSAPPPSWETPFP